MDSNQQVVLHKLLLILHRAFVESRNLALSQNCQELYELADTFEIVPSLMARWDSSTVEQIRGILEHYQSRRPASGYDYLSILDMTEEAFREVHCLERLPPAETP